MTKKTFTTKNENDNLTHLEWNEFTAYVNQIVDQVNSGGNSLGGGSTLPNLYINLKGNLNIETSDEIGNTSKGKINIESMNDIQFKPGDDIIFYSHHREEGKQDEVAIKVTDGDDIPVKLLLNTSEIVLTTKDKAGDNSNVMDITVNAAQNTRGYLKVRAQAIDLRSESHGGIALQPKGLDSQGHMNKIKFEHGGGDGLEFATFNTEKTSIFTDEYRFNKAGIWKMATRTKVASDKADVDDPTTTYKYVKASDDFYDNISSEDAQCTTEAIIKTSGALNNDYIETALSSKKNVKIATRSTYKIIAYEGTALGNEPTFTISNKDKSYFKDELKLIVSGSTKLSDLIDTKLPFLIDGDEGLYRLSGDITPKISLEAEEEVDLDAKYGDVVITSGDTIKQEAPEIRLNAINDDKTGGMVNFGATQDVVFLTNKLTASLNVESAATPTKIKMMLQNNYSEPVFFDSSVGKFRIPIKHLYLDSTLTTELYPANYANALPVYFDDGTRVGADYTCFIATKTVIDTATYTIIYKVGTKGSENVLKKTLGEPVAVYTNDSNDTTSNTSSLGVATSNNILNIEFEDYTFDGTGCQTVDSEEFVAIKEIQLGDILDIIGELKVMKENNEGPWAT